MKNRYAIISLLVLSLVLTGRLCAQDDDATTRVLKSGLVGAGTGALAAGVTGGKAGEGALIGAGTGIIGSILLDVITGNSAQRRGNEEDYYPADDPDDYYYETREDPSAKVLKDGLVGAGTGAIASGVSGGSAGKGALIGAGTGAIGNALLDTITKPSTQRRRKAYRKAPSKEEPKTKIIRKYDENGNLVYEEIIPID
ncbi:MAG: hypothetical protein ABH875_06885 [Candidatus Omnitrophota bacterium]